MESLLRVTFGVEITITLSMAPSFPLASGAIVPGGGGSEVTLVTGLATGGEYVPLFRTSWKTFSCNQTLNKFFNSLFIHKNIGWGYLKINMYL